MGGSGGGGRPCVNYQRLMTRVMLPKKLTRDEFFCWKRKKKSKQARSVIPEGTCMYTQTEEH